MRKTKELIINDRGVDKTFVITEFGCIDGQKWLLKAASLLVASGILKQGLEPVNQEELMTMAGDALAQGALERLTQIDPERVNALLGELLGCCAYRVDGQSLSLSSETNVNLYVDDLTTIFKLEFEALRLNFDFFVTALHAISPDKTSKKSKKPTTAA